MKIANNDKAVIFQELKPGDVFSTNRSAAIFMKTELYSGVNAVSIQDGKLTYCGPDATVYVVDCELVLQ